MAVESQAFFDVQQVFVHQLHGLAAVFCGQRGDDGLDQFRKNGWL